MRNKKKRYRIYQTDIDDEGRDCIKEMIKKINSSEGRDIFDKLMVIVESVFANIRTHKGLNGFILRGKSEVNIQWLLYCIVHNLGKITGYGIMYESTKN